jgi:hypothetical protein
MDVLKEVMMMNVLVLIDGWVGWIAVKIIPATIAGKPAQRMIFEFVIFISLSLIVFFR